MIQEACSYPAGSLDRRRLLTQLIYQIQQSGKLWQSPGKDLDCYHEALQQTWLFLCRNPDRYDPTKASLMTWLNNHLKFRFQDQQRNMQKTYQETLPDHWSSTGEWIDPFDRLPAPATVPPLLAEIEQWLQQEAPSLRRIHLRDRPEIHCQVLIRRRLPPETSWEQLSQLWTVPVSTLSNFYQRDCLPRLRAFVESQGYG